MSSKNAAKYCRYTNKPITTYFTTSHMTHTDNKHVMWLNNNNNNNNVLSTSTTQPRDDNAP